jgi:hypothetical protein
MVGVWYYLYKSLVVSAGERNVLEKRKRALCCLQAAAIQSLRPRTNRKKGAEIQELTYSDDNLNASSSLHVSCSDVLRLSIDRCYRCRYFRLFFRFGSTLNYPAHSSRRLTKFWSQSVNNTFHFVLLIVVTYYTGSALSRGLK